MSRIAEEVEKALREAGAGESAVELWRNAWASYQQGGAEAAQQTFDALIQEPEDDE